MMNRYGHAMHHKKSNQMATKNHTYPYNQTVQIWEISFDLGFDVINFEMILPIGSSCLESIFLCI